MNNDNHKNVALNLQEMGSYISKKEIKIFLSYSWANEDIANEIVSVFKDYGIQLFVDKESIKAYGDIGKFMEFIVEADFVIAIISDEYLTTTSPMKEATDFLGVKNNEKRIIPIVVEDTEIYSYKAGPKYINHWNKLVDEASLEVKRLAPAMAAHACEEVEKLLEISIRVGRFLQLLRYIKSPPLSDLKKSGFKKVVEYIYSNSYLTTEYPGFIEKANLDPLAKVMGVKSVEDGGYSDDNLYQMLLNAAQNGESLKFLKLAGPKDFRQNLICSTNPDHKPKIKYSGYNYYELLNNARIPEIKFILVNPFCESFLSKLDAEGKTTWKIVETSKKNIMFAKSLLRLAESRKITTGQDNTLIVGFHREELIWNICIFNDKKVLLKSYGEKGEVRGHSRSDGDNIQSRTTKEIVLETKSDSLIAESFLKYFNSISDKTNWITSNKLMDSYLSSCNFPSLYRGNAILEREASLLKVCMDVVSMKSEMLVLEKSRNKRWFNTPAMLKKEDSEWHGSITCMELIQGCCMFDVFHRFHTKSGTSVDEDQKIKDMLGYMFIHSLNAMNEYRETVVSMPRNKYQYASKIITGIKEIKLFLPIFDEELIDGVMEDVRDIGEIVSKEDISVFRDGHIKNRIIKYNTDNYLVKKDEGTLVEELVNALLGMDQDQAINYLERNIFDVDFEGANLEVSSWDDIAHLFMFENVGLFTIDEKLFLDRSKINDDENIIKFKKLGSEIVNIIENALNTEIDTKKMEGFWMSVLSRIIREFCRRVWYANVMQNTYYVRYGLEGRDYYLWLAIVCSFQISGVSNLKSFLVECAKQKDRIWGSIPFRSSVKSVKPNIF